MLDKSDLVQWSHCNIFQTVTKQRIARKYKMLSIRSLPLIVSYTFVGCLYLIVNPFLNIELLIPDFFVKGTWQWGGFSGVFAEIGSS